MEAKLATDNGVVLDSEFRLDELPLVIGRSLEAAVRVVDRWASRHHCEIDESDGALVVRDLGSRHGTLLNGEPITDATLKPGDRLTVGMTTFIVSANDGYRPKVHGAEDEASRDVSGPSARSRSS